MRKLKIEKTTLNNPFLALQLLEFMSIERFNQLFRITEDKLQTFMAHCLLNGHNFDTVISEENNLGRDRDNRFTRIKKWNWKKK